MLLLFCIFPTSIHTSPALSFLNPPLHSTIHTTTARMRPFSASSATSRVILMFATLGWIVSAIIINPKITSPAAKVVWPAGTTQTVTWCTEGIDDEDATGSIVLGYLSDDTNDRNEHLDYNHPLASGFKLKKGSQTIVVPNVVPRETYIIVLFGDSGNASPKFTITNPNPPKKSKRSRR